MGNTYGRLTVICFSHVKNNRTYWKCICECGNNTTVNGKYLTNGDTKSCGCLKPIRSSENGKKNKQYNQYYVKDNVVYVDINNEYMVCDLEDWNETAKEIKWFKNNTGYARGTITNTKKLILFHHTLFQHLKPNEEIDHINRNRLDNRRCNLRIVTKEQNLKNKNMYSNNTSGVTGVTWHKLKKQWIAYIQINKKHTILGCFNDIEEAIKVRKDAEIEIYGEYRRQ